MNQNQLELEIQMYLNEKKKVTQNTIDAYKRDLNPFIKYLDSKNIKSIKEVTQEVVLGYVEDIKKDKLSNSTTARKISALRGILKYFISNNTLDNSVLKDIEAPKVEHKIQEVISDDIIETLINSIGTKTEKDFRDRAMISLMAWTGIRVSEIIELSVSDYSLSKKALYLNQDLELSLPDNICNAIEEYFNHRTVESEYLFPNSSGDKMTRQGLWKVLKLRAKDSGLNEEQIKPNSLRQSLVTKLLKEGMSVDEVQWNLRYKGRERIENIYTQLKQAGEIIED